MNVDGNESAKYRPMLLIQVKNVANNFHIVGEISNLHAPECHLDSLRWRVSKACGIVQCCVCVCS